MEMRKQMRDGKEVGVLILVYTIDGFSFGLPLSSVDRIVRAVAVTPLSDAPDSILGVINVQGRIIPVVNTRMILRLKSREIAVEDKFILARTAELVMVIVADTVEGVVERPWAEVIAREGPNSRNDNLKGIVKLDGIPVPIHDLNRFLSTEAWAHKDAD